MARLSSPRCSGSGLLRRHLLFDQLAFDVDLDLVAHDELAVQHHLEFHSVVLAVELALGRVANPMTHVGSLNSPYLTTSREIALVTALMVRSPVSLYLSLPAGSILVLLNLMVGYLSTSRKFDDRRSLSLVSL